MTLYNRMVRDIVFHAFRGAQFYLNNGDLIARTFDENTVLCVVFGCKGLTELTAKEAQTVVRKAWKKNHLRAVRYSTGY